MTAPSVDTLLSRVDAALLYPPFLARVRLMLETLRSQHAVFWATCGWRSPGEQNRLYDIGRVPTWDAGKQVTRAVAFNSPHQFGIAIDLVRDIDERPGVQPSWAPEMYQPLHDAALEHDLAWGGDWRWPDRPHIQWPGYVDADDLSPLRAAWARGVQGGAGTVAALTSVWRFIDAHPSPTPQDRR